MATSNFPSQVSNVRMNAANKKQEKRDDDVPADSDDDFKYEEVSLEDEWSLIEGEEDLAATVKAIRDRAEASARGTRRPHATSSTHQPEAVVDFLRNFLFQTGMSETLDCFQNEWTEMTLKGLVDAERVGAVPDVYSENQRLDSELKRAVREREEYKLAASAAAETLVRVQKARDFHRLRHKRVVQEKNRVIEEMRRVQVQCNTYEPAVKRMNEKYQAVLKQVMLVASERDKALGQVNRASAQHRTPFCGGGEETREPSVKETVHPATQPRPPASPGPPRRQSRVQSAKASVP